MNLFSLIKLSVALLATYTAYSYAESPYSIVLGIAQDGGYPHAGCNKKCCREVWLDTSKKRGVACLGVVDPDTNQVWMFDATPDFREQLHVLNAELPDEARGQQMRIDGVFLTHAHIGHYTGLMFLGREAMATKSVPVYCMPKMAAFLESNGPWDQLVTLNNIQIQVMEENCKVVLNERISVTPLLVPHRGEYAETAGFIIQGPEHSVLFIPDIDKWTIWERSISELIKMVDCAYLDGTFYAAEELARMKNVPHPFIVESLEEFSALSLGDKQKVHFIHFNHTNPLIRDDSEEHAAIKNMGYNISCEEQKVSL